MPLKYKIISINLSSKWKHLYIKSESKTYILLLYCDIFFILSAYPFVNHLMFLGISRVEPKIRQYSSGTLTDHSLSGPPKDHSLLESHPVELHFTDQSSLELQRSLNLNIAS